MSTHVLDTATGTPAAGLRVTLLARSEGGDWRPLASGDTDADGRLNDLPEIEPGLHRLWFETSSSFFPEVIITFTVGDEEHLHVPLLLSPYGYTTYRGS